MSKKLLLKIIGIVIGVIGALTLITKHPILIGMEILGAAIWFIGDKLIKE